MMPLHYMRFCCLMACEIIFDTAIDLSVFSSGRHAQKRATGRVAVSRSKHRLALINEMTRPGLEPGISGSGGRRLIH